MRRLTRKREIIDLTTPTPPWKKSKLNSQLHHCNSPPLSSLSYEFDAPRRVFTAFDQKFKERSNHFSNLIIHSPKSKEMSDNLNQEIKKLGNFVSACYKPKKAEGLGLEDYRKLVYNLGYKKVKSSPSSRLDTVIEDRVLSTTEYLDKPKVFAKRGPTYKELYKKAKCRDERLSGLKYEQELTERIFASPLVDKLQWETPKEDLKELLKPLTDEEEAEVSKALHRKNR